MDKKRKDIFKKSEEDHEDGGHVSKRAKNDPEKESTEGETTCIFHEKQCFEEIV